MSLPKPPGHSDRPVDLHQLPTRPDYIYAHPEPTRNPKITAPPRRRGRSCCCNLCLWITTFILTKLLLLALVIGLAYIYLHPTLPEFHANKVSVSQIKLTYRNGKIGLDSQFEAVVKMINKNEDLSFKYKQIQFEIWATNLKNGESLLGRGSWPGFKQGRKNTTLVDVKVDVDSTETNQNTANEIVRKAKEGSLIMDVHVSTSVKVLYKNWEWSFVKAPVRLLCDGIVAGAAKTGDGPSCRENYIHGLLRYLHLIYN